MKNNIRSIKLMLLLLLFIKSNNISSQILQLSGNSNFFEYLRVYKDGYYNENDTTEGGEKVQFDRLCKKWSSRLYPHGNFNIANRAIIDYSINYKPNDSKFNPNWVCVGPNSNPINSNSNGVGQIHRITFDTRYGISNRIIYACSGFGGLWRTEDDGENWSNVNTDNLPIASVADVVVSPNDSSVIYIGTGVADEGITMEYSPNTGMLILYTL